MSVETVTLKNGAEEEKICVALIMMILNRLMDEGKSSTVYELYRLCRNPDYEPSDFDGIAERLKELDLASQIPTTAFRGTNKHDGCQWKVDNSTRNIVLSASEGEGMDLRLVNPLAKEGAKA